MMKVGNFGNVAHIIGRGNLIRIASLPVISIANNLLSDTGVTRNAYQ